jgi:hypothetical protein
MLSLLDQAFGGDDWHSLLGNLSGVTPEDWAWVPSGGRRSIRDIVRHVGGSKLMYQNHAFGDRGLTFQNPLVDGAGALDDLGSATSWLREAQGRLRGSIASLSDDELSRPRMANWGELKETRWLVEVLIAHDFYHAGEINHLRSIRRHDDIWAHERHSAEDEAPRT